MAWAATTTGASVAVAEPAPRAVHLGYGTEDGMKEALDKLDLLVRPGGPGRSG